MFYKKAVIKNFALITGKHLCWNLFLIVLQAFRPATLLKRDSNAGVFFIINATFLRTSILKKICKRLLLKFYPVVLFWFFRRYFRSSNLPAFYKVSVLKTSEKFLGKQSLILKTPFQQDISGRLLPIFRKLDIKTFNSKHLNSNSLILTIQF